jgi:hypothetical protein
MYIITAKCSCDGLPPFVCLSVFHNGVSHIQIMLLATIYSKTFPHTRSIATFGYNTGCKVPGKECELNGMASSYCHIDVFVPIATAILSNSCGHQ